MEFHSTLNISEKPEIGLAAAGGAACEGCAVAACGRLSRRACGELGFQTVRELADQLRGDVLDQAGRAAVLRDGAREIEVGLHHDLRAGGDRHEMEIDGGVRAAAAFRVLALRLCARLQVRFVDLGEFHLAGEGERDGPELHRDLAVIGVVVGLAGELRARHAGRDALDVEQNLPRLFRRQRHFEAVVDLHAPPL